MESLIPTCAVLAPRVGTVPITTCRTHVVPGPVIVAIGARRAARVPVQGLAPPVVLVPLWGPPRPVVPGSAKKDTIAPNAPFRTPIKGVARCSCIAHVVLPCRFKCRRAITPRVATVRHRTWTTAKQVVRTTMATTTSTLEQGNGCANPVTIAALSTVWTRTRVGCAVIARVVPTEASTGWNQWVVPAVARKAITAPPEPLNRPTAPPARTARSRTPVEPETSRGRGTR